MSFACAVSNHMPVAPRQTSQTARMHPGHSVPHLRTCAQKCQTDRLVSSFHFTHAPLQHSRTTQQHPMFFFLHPHTSLESHAQRFMTRKKKTMCVCVCENPRIPASRMRRVCVGADSHLRARLRRMFELTSCKESVTRRAQYCLIAVSLLISVCVCKCMCGMTGALCPVFLRAETWEFGNVRVEVTLCGMADV